MSLFRKKAPIVPPRTYAMPETYTEAFSFLEDARDYLVRRYATFDDKDHSDAKTILYESRKDIAEAIEGERRYGSRDGR